MTVHFTADHDADLSEYDSTTGDVAWRSYGGYNGGGSLYGRKNGGPDYATKDLGSIGNTLYVRGRFAVPGAAVVGLLRGRNTGGDTSWELSTSWPTAYAMQLSLKVYDNNGDSETLTLVPALPILGVGWAEVMITAGASAGAARGWVNGNSALAQTAVAANNDRLTRYLDVGPSVGVSTCWIHMDSIKAADEYQGPPLWTPVEVIPGVWKCTGEPSGGWQAVTGSARGIRVRISPITQTCSVHVGRGLRVMRRCVSTVEVSKRGKLLASSSSDPSCPSAYLPGADYGFFEYPSRAEQRARIS